MIHDQPCRWGVVTYSLLCVVTVTAKDRCFQHWELHNYLKWRFTDSHSDTTYQIQCRAIHTLHKLSMRCAACKEARYLSPSHSDCDFFLKKNWSLAGSLCVGKACKSSNCTVQIMGLWDCNDWSCCQTTLHHFPTCGGCRCPEQFQWKVHEVWIWKLTVLRAPRYMRDWQSLCLSSSVIIGYHWYQLQHQFTLRIQDDPDSYVLKCFE